MKTKYYALLLALFFFGFSAFLTAQTTSKEQETIKKEIRDAVGTIFTNLQKMDADALYRSYDDSPGFIQITTDGAMFDFQNAKKFHASWFMTLSNLKAERVKDAFRFLPGNNVIYSWLGKLEMTTKQGIRLIANQFAITFIFSKTGSMWKVIHQQGSSLPPVPVK